MLKRADKEQLVAELAEALRGAPAVVVASFQALTMAESAKLRRSLRPVGGRVRVVPKRLFRRVLDSLGWPAALAETDDSLAVAWAEDFLAPAKGLHQFTKSTERARLLGGILEGVPLDATAAERLALLPPLAALRGQLVRVLAGPLRGMLGIFGGVLRGLPAVLKAKAQIRVA